MADDAAGNGEVVVTIDPDLKELIPGYLKGRAGDAKAIGSAVKGGDYEAVRVIGHTMRGTGGGYGFDFITELGAGLEKAAKEKRADEISVLAKKLTDYLVRVKVIYKED